MASTRVQRATRRTLSEAGRLGTPAAESALVLAAMVDDVATPATARVAAAKELRAAVEEATRASAGKADPVDELRGRRERRLASSA